MISDEDVKIALNPEEAFWSKVRDEASKRIKDMRHEIIINEAITKLANEKLAENENGE